MPVGVIITLSDLFPFIFNIRYISYGSIIPWLYIYTLPSYLTLYTTITMPKEGNQNFQSEEVSSYIDALV